MFLISKFVYDLVQKSKDDKTSPYLLIEDYLAANHKQTFYKFRFGAKNKVDKNGDDVYGEEEPVVLERGAFEKIWSLEKFVLSERVLAIFGHSSDLFLRGLELINSPFIDPAYPGKLQLIVRNFSNEQVTLSVGDIIGKITFFDISETILSADTLLDEIREHAENRIRERTAKALFDRS
jgi:deoxycytidine triphosphate deaminase